MQQFLQEPPKVSGAWIMPCERLLTFLDTAPEELRPACMEPLCSSAAPRYIETPKSTPTPTRACSTQHCVAAWRHTNAYSLAVLPTVQIEG